MKKMILTVVSAAMLFGAVVAATSQLRAGEPLLDVLRSELDYEFGRLSSAETPPYYMNFRVTDTRSRTVSASFGVLTDSVDTRERVFMPHIRLGSPEFDNFHGGGSADYEARYRSVLLPLEDGRPDAVRQTIWREVDKTYRASVTELEKQRAAERVNVARDDKAPDFSPAPVETYYEEPLTDAQTAFDMAEMARRVKLYSAVFAEKPELLSGRANISFDVERKYLVSSEGTSVVQNWRFCRLAVSAYVRTDDGMDLPLFCDFSAFSPGELPSDEVVLAEVRKVAETLVAMKNAPVVTPYTGPALLSGEASGVFFHEIFGHRIEGQRMKSDSDGQTFKKMIGKSVLPRHFSVVDDPTMERLDGKALHGYYIYDDQGVKGRKVEVVKNGVLNEFLMTRTPTDEFAASNGHSRAQSNLDPTSRQSNLIISTDKPLTDAQLRKALIKEAKAQKCEFGLYFKETTGGFTMTGRYMANSFNVMPLEVYKIYVDGRPDELVRGVDLIGTPLSMFANIIEAGSEPEIFTGNCGAESGWVPVTAVSPQILVKKVEVQRKAKTTDLPPILPRP